MLDNIDSVRDAESLRQKPFPKSSTFPANLTLTLRVPITMAEDYIADCPKSSTVRTHLPLVATRPEDLAPVCTRRKV